MKLIKYAKLSATITIFSGPPDTEIPTIFGLYKFGSRKIGNYFLKNNFDRRIMGDWAK